jgi:hypothetical protein
MLTELPLAFDRDAAVPDDVLRFAAAGLARGKAIGCFDFIPCDAAHAWRVLSSLETGHLCEWGSGIGVVAGMARMLGFEVTGIEINEELANQSRVFLREYDLDCQIHHASYLDLDVAADYYFVYCWPGQTLRVQERFEVSTPKEAKLLICHGAEDIRCRVKAAGGAVGYLDSDDP